MRRYGIMVLLGLVPALYGAPAWAATSIVTSPTEYEQLSRRVNAVTGRSIEEVRRGLDGLAGKHVELSGKILGNAHRAGGTTETVDVWLCSDNDRCFVPCPTGLPELQPGRSVRMLVQMADHPRDISDCQLKAVTEARLVEPGPVPAAAGTSATRRRIEGEGGTRPATGAPSEAALPAPPGGTILPVAAGSALPPEMRGMPGLVGPAAKVPSVPQPAAMARPANVAMVATPRFSGEQAVQLWARWVRQRNPELSGEQADLIVRWTVYYCALHQVDHRLMFAVMKYESDFNPRCLSHAGAMGLTQLMPCNVEDFKVRDPWDIAENIRGGVEHLAEFLRKYQNLSNYEQTVLALACYNAGPGAVAKYGGVPPYEETQSYVRKVPKLFAELVQQGYP